MTEHITEPKFGASLKWQSVNVTVQVVLQLVFIAALARLIPTDAFGIMAIALVVVGFIEIFAQVGIGPALIQYPNVTRDHKKTAFVFSLGWGSFSLSEHSSPLQQSHPFTTNLFWSRS